MRTPIVAVALLLHALPVGAQNKTAAAQTQPADTQPQPSRAAKKAIGPLVAKAVAQVNYPSVYNLSLAEAQKAFAAVKLQCAVVRIGGGDPSPNDIVVEQVPTPGPSFPTKVCTLSVRPQYVNVQQTPSVIGRSLEDALRRIKIAELKANRSWVPSRDTALISVVAQDPPPDAPIRPDRTIDIQIAGVPQVVGLTVDAAKTALERAHLVVGATTVRDSTEGNDGTVLEQAPQAGDSTSPGTTVALTVVRVIVPTFAMPDLKGRSITQALSTIADSGLVFKGMEIAKAEGSPDTVVGQSPDPGTLVRRGDAVSLTGGRPITTVVPDFTHTRIDQISSLAGAGSLTIVSRFSEPTRDAQDSMVTDQSLPAGGRVPIGSRITLTVSLRQATGGVTGTTSVPWLLILAIALGVAALGWGVRRFRRWRQKPPIPVPPPVFDYKLDVPGIETRITDTHGHGLELSLVSHTGETDHALELAGAQLFNEENTHG